LVGFGVSGAPWLQGDQGGDRGGIRGDQSGLLRDRGLLRRPKVLYCLHGRGIETFPSIYIILLESEKHSRNVPEKYGALRCAGGSVRASLREVTSRILQTPLFPQDASIDKRASGAAGLTCASGRRQWRRAPGDGRETHTHRRARNVTPLCAPPPTLCKTCDRMDMPRMPRNDSLVCLAPPLRGPCL